MVREKCICFNRAGLVLLPSLLKLVAGQPPDVEVAFRRRGLTQCIPKARHLRQPRKAPVLPEDVGSLVVTVVHVVLGFRLTPRQIVALEFPSLTDGERRYPHARKAEMIGAVVVSRLRMRVRSDRQPQFSRNLLNSGIERRALGAANLDLF